MYAYEMCILCVYMYVYLCQWAEHVVDLSMLKYQYIYICIYIYILCVYMCECACHVGRARCNMHAAIHAGQILSFL